MKLAEAVLQEVVDFKVEADRFQVSLLQTKHILCILIIWHDTDCACWLSAAVCLRLFSYLFETLLELQAKQNAKAQYSSLLSK